MRTAERRCPQDSAFTIAIKNSTHVISCDRNVEFNGNWNEYCFLLVLNVITHDGIARQCCIDLEGANRLPFSPDVTVAPRPLPLQAQRDA